MPMHERIAIIIPYFQRQRGLLTRALGSIFNQRNLSSPRIIIVDDSSPLPAEAELQDMPLAWRQAIHLIHQPNGGAGSARNAALDAVPADTDHVALLDPDDTWMEDHLDQAMAAMRLGHDFYFADCRRHDETTGYLGRCGVDPAAHELILPERDIHAFTGDFFDQTLRHAPIGTSTVVMRKSRLGHLRFSTEMRTTGEDLLFWLDAAHVTRRVAFSTRLAMILGEGINLSVAPEWASNKSLSVLKGYADCYAEVGRRFALTSEQDRFIRARAQECQRAFVLTVLGICRRGKLPAPGLLFSYLRHNPGVLAMGPRILAARLAGR